MFYSVDILSRKNRNGLGVIWLASTSRTSSCKRLTRKDYLSVNLPDACEYLVSPPEPLALRLSSNLMMGITRVYSHQCNYYYQDVQSVFTNLSKSYLVGAADHKVMLAAPQARPDSITLQALNDETAYMALNNVTFNAEKIIGNMEAFEWNANAKKRASTSGPLPGASALVPSPSGIPSPQSAIGLISPLHDMPSSSTDMSIGSDLLQQLHQDHLLSGGDQQRSRLHSAPTSDGSFGMALGGAGDIFDEDFNATMQINAPLNSPVVEITRSPASVIDCTRKDPAFTIDDPVNYDFPVAEDFGLATEVQQDEIAHNAPKRRKVRLIIRIDAAFSS